MDQALETWAAIVALKISPIIADDPPPPSSSEASAGMSVCARCAVTLAPHGKAARSPAGRGPSPPPPRTWVATSSTCLKPW
jgi:hypothetical protein